VTNPDTLDAQDIKRWDCEHVWHAFTQMADYQPFVVEHADGVWLFDIDGNRYLDGVSSLWCNVHGHNHPLINNAIKQQLDRVAHVTSLGSSNTTTIALAKRLADLAPGDLQHVFFSSDGASAVEVALKMAFQYWRQIENPQPNRSKYIALGNAYHGDTIGSVSVGGVARFHEMFKPLLFEVIRGPSPDTFRLPDDITSADAASFYLEQYEALLREHADNCAALVIEPIIQGAAGMIVHPTGFLAGIRELTRKYDVLLIADEVAVGIGRTGKMFACQHESVQPDILCLGKGLSGGYLPLAATIASKQIFKAFLGNNEQSVSKTLYHGHTFSGNPTCAAAALANLDVFDLEDTLEHVRSLQPQFRDHLLQFRDHPNVGDVRSVGLIGAIELVKDKGSNEPFDAAEKRGAKVCKHALEKHVWLRPLGDVIVVMPPLCVTIKELEILFDAIAYGIHTEFS
jgi:adenosylmethionine---8-amino-7-oxononanoate aminotransferase